LSASAGGVQRGEDAEEHGRQHRRGEREQQNGGVERNAFGAGKTPGEERGQRVDAPRRQEEAERAAGERQHDALGEHLPHDAPARRAERRADGELPLAGGRSREHQVGHVGAGDEQDERHGREQDPQPGTRPAHQPIGERLDRNGDVGVRLWIRARERFALRGNLRPRLIDADPLFQTRESAEDPETAVLGLGARGPVERTQARPQLKLGGREPEPRRRHPDDGVGCSAQIDRAADDRRIAAEA
jgi:hypothetical protein